MRSVKQKVNFVELPRISTDESTGSRQWLAEHLVRFDKFRSDPKFKELVRRMGLPE